MSTRHAPVDSPFNQERFCSSPELETGLMANLVAKRCTTLNSDADRELIWFVQMISHQEGGLKKLAAGLVNAFPDRVATKSMLRFGFEPAQIYSANQVKQIRVELPRRSVNRIDYPLKGEDRHKDYLVYPDASAELIARLHEERDQRQAEADRHPNTYPAKVFIDKCREAASDLARHLGELCLDPGIDLGSHELWYFPGIVAALREYRRQWIERQSAGLVITEIGHKVEDALDFALDGRGMVLLHGFARTGKTFAACKWCARHPGTARFVEIPPGASDIGFFRAIAESLGVSINLNSKAHQLRDRCEAVLFTGQQMLVLDEAHRIWPESNYRDALPFRLSWIMMLVNRKIPVALVTTKQFFTAQKRTEKKTGWASEQFQGRLLHCEHLPDILSRADLESVARALLPDGDSKSIDLLVTNAQSSEKYLAGIEIVAKRARYLAKKQGRENVLRADIKNAIAGAAIPSSNALALAMEITPAGVPRPSRSAPAVVPQSGRTTDLAALSVRVPTLNPNQSVTD